MTKELDQNQKFVLSEFRRLGVASKADVVRIVGLSHPAVTHIVKKLVSFGYLDKTRKKRQGERGQPATIYRLSNRTVFIGIHLGRKRLLFVALTLDGQVLARQKINVGFLQRVELESISRQELSRFLALPELENKHIAGIGISTPYFWEGWGRELGIDSAPDRGWNSDHVLDLFDFPDAVPVFVENDGSAAALAELTFGAGKQLTDFVYVYIGTFIGGGIVIDGTLRIGAKGNSGAIGTFPVSPARLSGADDAARKPFESLLNRVSLNSLFRVAEKHGVEMSTENLDRVLDECPEEFLQEWIEDCGKALAQFFIGVWSLIDVEAIILGGALPENVLERLIGAVKSEVRKMSVEGIIVSDICPGRLGVWAISVGAACLPILRLLGPVAPAQHVKQKTPGSGVTRIFEQD